MKTYVLDTNVVLYDPNAILKFADNEVVIPITVIEEVDTFKKDANEVGRNARHFARILDEFRNGGGTLIQGVKLSSGGTLRVDLGEKRKREGEERITHIFTRNHADVNILAIALSVKEKSKHPVIFLSKDTNLRIRADALGLVSEDYDPQVVDIEELYKGWREVTWSNDRLSRFAIDRSMPLDAQEGFPNELFLIKASDGKGSMLGRVHAKDKSLHAISEFKRPVWGIQPRNLEQTFALDLLLDDSVSLVTLVGKAGTGKTLLALAAGLYKTMEEQVYQRVLVSRPVFPMGRDIGFLPGDLEEKLMPWMQPIFDNVELLLTLSSGKDRRRSRPVARHEELIEQGVLAIEPLTYIRGRSIPHQYMIVDEAQNLTPHEIKTIITRAGDNTKVILTGDPYQIDNPYVDSSTNGLTYVVERLKKEGMSGHMTLKRGERSPLAELASNVL